MTHSRQGNTARFALVTAGHHFLTRVLPFRHPDSRAALETFVAVATRITLPSSELDAVLLRCLAVLDSHGTGTIPRLIDRYLTESVIPTECLSHFAHCVTEFLRYECITDGSVQEALHLVSTYFSESTCSPQWIAERMNVRLATLDVGFKRETGRTMTDHIRATRLDRAAVLLATTSLSVKEIWALVGYSHHSNFDHDFKRRFRANPRSYRAHILRPVAKSLYFKSAPATIGSSGSP